ncbi:hypothetical protein DL98DRAFT_596156 [Cadophora sp. DSE1049]|nr:hypothetical protein DL98DRAFT_596156 [Cadophora sp. DSE1049]
MNLTNEQRTERRRIQWAARYQRVKKQEEEEEEATRRDSNTDVQRTLRHSPSHGNTPLAADQPLDSGSQVSGAVHGLALRQKPDDGEVRWVKSLTPENYTATVEVGFRCLVNVRGQCLKASLVVAPRREQSLAPSTAFNHSGGGASLGAWSSQRTSTYTGGPLLQPVETAIRQTQPVIGQDDAYPAEARREVRLPPTAELDLLFRWLSDFTQYDNDDPRILLRQFRK